MCACAVQFLYFVARFGPLELTISKVRTSNNTKSSIYPYDKYGD